MSRRTRPVPAGVLLLCLLAAAEPARAQQPASAGGGKGDVAPQPVALENTELRRLRSAAVGQDYEVRVRLPFDYETSGKRYPVLYLLDGDHAFGLANDLVTYLEITASIPELIVVSPAYGGRRGPDSGGVNRRARDFNPFPEAGNPDPPGAEAYWRFVRDELIPWADATYRTDPSDRTLWGYSRGAHFGLYALFQQPQPFQRFIMLDGFRLELLDVEKEFAATNRELPVRLFLASGVPSAGLMRFVAALRERRYEGMLWDYFPLTSLTHTAVSGEGLARGLKFVFNKKSIYEEMIALLRTESGDAALAHYRARKLAAPAEYEWGEAELEQVGRSLLIMGRPADAVTVLTFNAELFPEHAASYNALGEAHLRLEDRAAAAEAFEKALALNPGDARAKAVLEELRGAGK